MNKKILYALGGIVLSGSLLLSGNVYANYPENYHGASASDGRVDVSSVNYNGNTVSLNLQLKNLDHFAVRDLHKLWFDLVESGNLENHPDTDVSIVDEDKGLVQFTFNVNDLEAGKTYGSTLYTEDSFAGIVIPDATFTINNKEVMIKDSKITVKEVSALSNKEITSKQTTQTEDTNGISEKRNKASESENKQDNPYKKSLPATTAVK